MAVYLGLDVGTTAVKAALFSADGALLGASAREYALDRPTPEAVELDPEVYWEAVRATTREALDAAGLEGTRVRALAISSQGETLVPVDASGRPTRPAIVWLDNRPAAEASLIETEFGAAAVYRVTGQPQVVPTWPACRILWLRRNQPEVFRRTARFLLVEDFLLHRLTGAWATETALQSSSLMLDIGRRRWWPEMLDFLEIGPERLGELTEPGRAVGRLTPEAAQALGLTPEALVVAGSLDQVAAAVGAGNVREGIVSATTGSVLALVCTTAEPVFDPGGRVPCHLHALPGHYCLLPWGQTAGMALRWFRDQFWPELADQAGAYEVMTAAAATVPAGSEGLVALPHLEGAASPEFNPRAKGVFFGFTPRHGRAHFTRALLESVAYMLRRNLEVVEEVGLSAGEVRAMGGGAKSPLWLQIKADVTGLPVRAVAAEEASCLGAAMLAAVGAGDFQGLPEAAEAMSGLGRRFEPNPAHRSVYDGGYRRYVELYERLAPMFTW